MRVGTIHTNINTVMLWLSKKVTFEDEYQTQPGELEEHSFQH